MDSNELKFYSFMLTVLGNTVARHFVKIINKYPPELRPVVIGQMEACIAGTRSTFSEKENKIADEIRGLSDIVTIIKTQPADDKED